MKFWKQDPMEGAPTTPPDYDLGARQFDSQTGNPMNTPLGSDPLQQFSSQQFSSQDPMQNMQNNNNLDSFGQSQPSVQEKIMLQQTQQYPPAQPFPGSVPFQQQQYAQQYPQGPQGQVQDSLHVRDTELILAKLDGIKSELDALHQRVRKIEQYYDAQTAQTQQKKYW